MNRLFFSIWLLLVILLCTEESAQYNSPGATDERPALWAVFENMIQSEGSEAYSDEDYETDELLQEEGMSSELEEIEERSLLYPGARAIPHKVCKVETKHIPLETDGYEYSLSHYKNLTCKETTDRPFQYKTTHSEYCVVFHHPHERISCQTKYTRVPMFRRKSNKHHWEKIIQSVAVGCDCAIGLKYL